MHMHTHIVCIHLYTSVTKIKEPQNHFIPNVKETLKSGTFLQHSSIAPSINVAELDFDAFDNYSDDDDDDDDGYVNDDEMKKAISAVKTQQT